MINPPIRKLHPDNECPPCGREIALQYTHCSRICWLEDRDFEPMEG